MAAATAAAKQQQQAIIAELKGMQPIAVRTKEQCSFSRARKAQAYALPIIADRYLVKNIHYTRLKRDSEGRKAHTPREAHRGKTLTHSPKDDLDDATRNPLLSCQHQEVAARYHRTRCA